MQKDSEFFLLVSTYSDDVDALLCRYNRVSDMTTRIEDRSGIWVGWLGAYPRADPNPVAPDLTSNA